VRANEAVFISKRGTYAPIKAISSQGPPSPPASIRVESSEPRPPLARCTAKMWKRQAWRSTYGCTCIAPSGALRTCPHSPPRFSTRAGSTTRIRRIAEGWFTEWGLRAGGVHTSRFARFCRLESEDKVAGVEPWPVKVAGFALIAIF
jgi:hypothetical protein